MNIVRRNDERDKVRPEYILCKVFR